MRFRLLVAGLLACICLGFGLFAYTTYQALWGSGYRYREAQAALARRDFTAATEHIDRCLADQPNNIDAHLLAARIARRASLPALPGGLDGAGACLIAGQGAGVGVLDLPRFEQHLADYHRLGGMPEFFNFEKNLLSAQQGELAAPMEWNGASLSLENLLRRWVAENHPETPLILEALTKGYLQIYRLPDAEGMLNLWLAREEDEQALLWRAWVGLRLGDAASALRDYQRALALDPNHDKLRLRVAAIVQRTVGPAEAAAHYHILLDRNVKDPAILLGLAQCKKALGEEDAYRQLLAKQREQFPESVDGLQEQAKLALEDKRPADAEELLRQAVKLAPFDPLANYNLYLCLLQTGKKEEARALGAKRERIESDLNRMDELSRLVMKRPYDPDLRTEAGQILLRNGMPGPGRAWLLTALDIDSEHKPAHQALADFYDKQGNAPELAAFHRKRAGG